MDTADPRILRAIEHATLAARSRRLAEADKLLRPGMEKAADRQSELAAAVLEDVCRAN